MIISGIADEAGPGIEDQIRAHKELGWKSIELRAVDGMNVAAALPDEEFEKVADKVLESGLQVTCFASAVGNWSRNIRDNFSMDTDELKTAITRMNRFGTKYIRTMSWVGDGVPQDEWRDKTILRYKELAKIAEDGNIILAHENCTGWAGQSAEYQRQLMEEIDSKNLCVLFDTGNTVGYGYDPLAYYKGVKDLLRYIHIKDCRANPDGGKSSAFTFPGEGDAKVKEILGDLRASGYEGVVSIEPHVAAIAHDSSVEPSAEDMFNSYLKYGRMTTEIVENL